MIVIGKSGIAGAAPRIDVARQPMAGADNDLFVEAMAGPVHVRVLSEGQVLFSHDCKDPPCHERFLIPDSAAGKALHVHVTDSQGSVGQQSFDIDHAQRSAS